MESPDPQCAKFAQKPQQAGTGTNDFIHSINKHIYQITNAKGKISTSCQKGRTCGLEISLTKGRIKEEYLK